MWLTAAGHAAWIKNNKRQTKQAKVRVRFAYNCGAGPCLKSYSLSKWVKGVFLQG